LARTGTEGRRRMNKTDPSIWGSPQIVEKAFTWLNEYLPASSDRWVVADVYRSWMAARTQALKRDYPSLAKKDCWCIAQTEWNELRRQQKRAARKG
jgi:hypothetical protein